MMGVLRYILVLCSVGVVWFGQLAAAEAEILWSGHLRGTGFVDYYHGDHFLAEFQGNRSFINGALDGRLNSRFHLTELTSFSVSYEAVARAGQTLQTLNDIAKLDPEFVNTALYQRGVPTDDNQLFSLTKVISEGDDYLVYHRLDRLFLAHDGSLGNFSLGRQALTWGNGLLFNPADLVNPFAPSDIIRDYKIGSDMLLYQNGFDNLSDVQLVVVPRTGENDELDFDQSTYGLKTKFSCDYGDLDVYLMKNYEDPVVGAGFSTYLGDGVVRSDITWTDLRDDSEKGSFFSGVLNYDRSWTWSDRNWYGFIELYYNGLGEANPLEALQSQALVDRLARGEIFVTGRYYVDILLQYEAHPLVNLIATVIYNLEDNSFLFQPRMDWEISQSIDLLLGVNVAWGPEDSEFGELTDPQLGSGIGRPSQAYLVATFFF